jgi:hypothetical protein
MREQIKLDDNNYQAATIRNTYITRPSVRVERPLRTNTRCLRFVRMIIDGSHRFPGTPVVIPRIVLSTTLDKTGRSRDQVNSRRHPPERSPLLYSAAGSSARAPAWTPGSEGAYRCLS